MPCYSNTILLSLTLPSTFIRLSVTLSPFSKMKMKSYHFIMEQDFRTQTVWDAQTSICEGNSDQIYLRFFSVFFLVTKWELDYASYSLQCIQKVFTVLHLFRTLSFYNLVPKWIIFFQYWIMTKLKKNSLQTCMTFKTELSRILFPLIICSDVSTAWMSTCGKFSSLDMIWKET